MPRALLLALVLTLLPGTFLWAVVGGSMIASCALVRGAALGLAPRRGTTLRAA